MRTCAAVVFGLLLMVVARADAASVDDAIKARSGSDSKAQMQVIDDLIDMGPGAKAAVPALVKALNGGSTELQWHVAMAHQRDRPRR